MHDIVVRRAVPWELLLLAVIVVAAKQWESDAPIWSADFVFAAKHWPRVAKLPTGAMNEAEWLVLSRLDFRTLVSRRELQESCCSEPDVQRQRPAALTPPPPSCVPSCVPVHAIKSRTP